MVEYVQLELTDIIADKQTQLRAAMNIDLVVEYAEAMKAGDVFPAIVVFRDDAGFILSEGWHRFEAAKEADEPNILVEVHEPNEGETALESAIRHAAGSNAQHGMRRTNEDKYKAVVALLKRDTWKDRSDRWIAEEAKVAHTFVGKVRKDLEPTPSDDKPQTRKGKDDKVYSKTPKKKKSKGGRPKKSQKQENEEAGQISALASDQPPAPDPIVMSKDMLLPDTVLEQLRIVATIFKVIPDPHESFAQMLKSGGGYFNADWAEYWGDWFHAYARDVREHEAAPKVMPEAEAASPVAADTGVPEVVVEEASGKI